MIIPTLVDAVAALLYAIAALVNALDRLLSSGLAQWIGGGLVSLILYYVARRDSRREAKELRRLNIMMMNAMEGAGLVKWARDENGNPTGRLIEVSARLQNLWNVRANPSPPAEPENLDPPEQDTGEPGYRE